MTSVDAGAAAVAGVRRARGRNARLALTHVASRLWGVAAFITLWQFAAKAYDNQFVPPPSDIWTRFVDRWLTWEQLTDVMLPTLRRLAFGLVACILAGVAIGSVLGLVPVVRSMARPIINFFMAVPATAFAPAAVVIIGLNNRTTVFLIVLGSLWPILVNTADGVAGTDDSWVRSARALGLSRRRSFFQVRLPAAAPQIMSGIRVSLSVAVILTVVAELYASPNGVGFELNRARETFRILDVWAAIAFLSFLGVSLSLGYGLIERRVLRWQQLQASAAGG